MSNFIKTPGVKSLALVGIVALAAGCAREPVAEPVMAAPAPVTAEPVYTGKYN